jgi:Tfp pilus assembly protein PilN
VRPINLIPVEQRRGAARGTSHGGGPSSDIGVYAVLGGLGAAVLCVLAFVMTSNSINSKTDELAKVQAESQGDKQVADSLRPYGQFASLQQAREEQITALASGRFDWERSLQQLSQALPDNVYLLTVAATQSPDVEVDGGGGGDVTNLRQKSPAPAFALSGCTYSQHAVARMMTRMHNLDDVTAVRLSKSVRKEDTAGTVGTAVTQDNAAQQDIQDCVGSSRVTKFDLLIEFGGATTAQAGAAAGVPSAAAQPIAAAQGAVAQSNAASAGATGASGATGAAGTTPGGSAP